ncbi:MAG: DUF4870 domain-containing protein [Acidimicrobiia bacterium]|nr:DUF4870 domain-containing protein [Acidimicrobiia bacterium]
MTTETPQPTPQVVTNDSRNLATASHLSAFIMFLGIPSLVGPLLVWLFKKDDPWVEYHAKEALNFNISFMIWALISALSILLLVGLILLPVVAISWFVLAIRAAIATSNGNYYRYPMTMRFVS